MGSWKTRTVLFGSSISAISRGMTQLEVSYLFKHACICVRAYSAASGMQSNLCFHLPTHPTMLRNAHCYSLTALHRVFVSHIWNQMPVSLKRLAEGDQFAKQLLYVFMAFLLQLVTSSEPGLMNSTTSRACWFPVQSQGPAGMPHHLPTWLQVRGDMLKAKPTRWKPKAKTIKRFAGSQREVLALRWGFTQLRSSLVGKRPLKQVQPPLMVYT